MQALTRTICILWRAESRGAQYTTHMSSIVRTMYVLVVIGMSACKGRSNGNTTPPDRLADGELVSGPAVAVGIKLPRGSELLLDSSLMLKANVKSDCKALTEFVAVQLESGADHRTPKGFERVRIKGTAPRDYRVELTPNSGGGCYVLFSQLEPELTIKDEAARIEMLRRSGYGADGKPLKQVTE